MPKNPFNRSKKKDDKDEKIKVKLRRSKSNKKVSDDESVGSYPSQIGFSDASNKQTAGQSTDSKGRPLISPSVVGSDTVSLSSVRSVYSLDPVKRQQDIDRKNASSKHILGVFYLRKKEYDKAMEYLRVSCQARINLHGQMHGLVLETQSIIADTLIVQQKNEEAIALLKQMASTVKIIQREQADNDDDSVYSGAADSSKLLGGKTVDLDALYENTLNRLEGLGVSLAPTQEEIQEQIKDVPESDIYVGSHLEDDFSAAPIARQVRIVGTSEGSNPDVEQDDLHEQQVEARRQLKLATIDDIKKGLDMYADGEIPKAKEYFHEHLDDWTKILGHNHTSIIQVREHLGDIEFQNENYEEAKSHFEEAERASKIISEEESTDCDRLLKKLRLAEQKWADKQAADHFFDEAYTLHEKQLEFNTDVDSVLQEEDLIQKASILFMKGDYEGAKVPLSEVLRKTAHQGDDQNPLFLNMIGMILFAESRYDEARVYFEKAHKNTKTSGVVIEPIQKTNILYNLGYSYVHTLQFEKANDNFILALDELEKCDFSDVDKKTEQVRILTKLGHSSFHLGQLDMAYDYYQKAFTIEMDLYNDDTRTITLNLRRYIGLTRAHQGRYDDALYVFDGVLYSQDRDDWPDCLICAKTLIDMSEIYFVCGSLKLSEKKQLQLAQLCCKRASEVYTANKLTSDHPYVKQASKLQTLIDIIEEA